MPVASNVSAPASASSSPIKQQPSSLSSSLFKPRSSTSLVGMGSDAASPTKSSSNGLAQTPFSSPTKSSANGSPTRDAAHTAKPGHVEPVFITSKDFGASAEPEEEQTQKEEPVNENGTKRSDRKSKTDAISAMSGKDQVNGDDSHSANGANGALVPGQPNPASHPIRKAKLEQRAPLLRFNQGGAEQLSSSEDPGIPTAASTPRHPPSRQRSRIFELEEAPTFYPTMEEFEDPMKYISWVGDYCNGKDYGIVKIVPPEGWNPECVLDQETFRFRTRVQRLNSLSADARASQNYQEQLQKFHAQQGSKRVSIPVIDRKPVDLYSLKLIVSSLGGFDHVCRNRKWAEVTRGIGYNEENSAHLSTQVKAAYTRIILPFEEFLLKAKDQARMSLNGSAISPSVPQSASFSTPGPSDPMKRGAESASPTLDGRLNGDRGASASTPEPSGSAATDLGDDGSSAKRRSARKRSDANGAARAPSTPTPSGKRKGSSPHADGGSARKDVAIVPGAEEQMCEICLRGEDGLNMLLCDDCNRGYHMYCLQPPLTAIPKSQWYCPPCLVGTGHDFGFEDGETHSLYTFWQRAEKFKQAWWKAHPDRVWKPTSEDVDMDVDGEELKTNGLARRIPGTDLIVSEDDVEREFWRLVYEQDEVVEVEYGADVHSTTHGSALPTAETHPLSPYSRDKWNLNNLPILPASLLQYIKSDISGMTVPWIYVGMIFSTFCWHNEDHFTYSINYQHWGETKTWYGVPGSDAEKLEDALKKSAPDLFETLPDLLFHLTTMMSPDKLKKEGVKVYACDQRANEFVVTFPKAYHSGFNHGLNLNEAVNFALPNWIQDGLESTRRYQLHKKPAVFSHDQLVVTVSQQNHTVETALWLQHAMKEMVEREISKRDHLRQMIPNLHEVVDESDRPENEYQCAHCTIFCYLGQIISDKAEGVACLDHGSEVCHADPPSRWTLRMRSSDEQLQANYAKVAERAAIPRNWLKRVRTQLSSVGRPTLKTLKSLVNDGEKIQYPLEELEDLRDFVNVASNWVERANVFLVRKHHKRRGDGATAGGRSRRSVIAEDSPASRLTAEPQDDAASEAGVDRSREALSKLLAKLDGLPFDVPEIASLQTLSAELDLFVRKAQNILEQGRSSIDSDTKEPSLKECEAILTLGSSLNVDAPEIEELSKYVDRRKWVEEVEDVGNTYIYHHEVEEFLEKARSCGLMTHKLKEELERRSKAGKEWSEKAKALLEGEKPVSVEQLEQLSEVSTEVAAVLEIAQKVTSTLNKAKELQKSLKSLHSDANAQTPSNAEGIVTNPASDKLTEDARRALVNEARRVLRAVKAYNLSLELADETQNALDLYDTWRGDLFTDVVSHFAPHRKMGDTEKRTELDKLAKKVQNTTEPDDDDPETTKRHCLCRTADEPPVSTNTAAKCTECQESYHLPCLKVKHSEVKGAGGHWKCPLCAPHALDDVLKARKSIELVKAVSLLQAPKFSKDLLLFAPAEVDILRTMVSQAERLQACVQKFVDSKPLSTHPPHAKAYRHHLRRLLGCPINVTPGNSGSAIDNLSEHVVGELNRAEAAAAAQAQDQMDVTFDDLGNESMLEAPGASEDTPSVRRTTHVSTASSNAIKDDRKRKRGKRAKLMFREEIGIRAHKNGMPIYCLCHQPESGSMIACDKCLLWFHQYCVRLENPPGLSEELWNCPMCCIKAERKYPQAEVRVKDIGVTDPDLWLDVRATLRSTEKPVSKRQAWSAEPSRRIVLHLENFTPAIQAEDAQAESAKRPRVATDTPSRARTNTAQSDVAAKLTPTVPSSSADVAKAASPLAATNGSVSSAATESVAKQVVNAPFEAAPASAPANAPAAKQPGHTRQPSGLSNSDYGTMSAPPSVSPASVLVTYATRPLMQADPYELAKRRHREGIALLFSRGVTEAMLLRHYIAWDGRCLVHPVPDRYGGYTEVPLGSRIRLDSDDQDGMRLIRAAKHRYFNPHDSDRSSSRRNLYGETYSHGSRDYDHNYDSPYTGHRQPHRPDPRFSVPTATAYDSYGGYSRYPESSPSLSELVIAPLPPHENRMPPPPPAAPPVVRSNGVASSPGPMAATTQSPSLAPTPSPLPRPMQPPSLDRASRPIASPRPAEQRPSSVSAPSPRPMEQRPSVLSAPSSGAREAVPPPPAPTPAPPSATLTAPPTPSYAVRSPRSPAAQLSASLKSPLTSAPTPPPAAKVPQYSEELKSARAMARRMRPTASDSEIDEMVKAFFSNSAVS